MYDVAIIGAGIAGLAAAEILHGAGVSTVVLESRERIGGRAYSPTLEGAPLDFGPTWVWDSETEVLALLERLGLSLFDQYQQGFDLYQDERGVHSLELPRSADAERRLVGGAEALAHALHSRIGEMRLKKKVLALSAHPKCLQLQLEHDSVEAQFVLAALPPRLFESSVKLPGVSEENLAHWRQTPVWMGDIAKVLCIFSSAFWREQGLSGRAVSRLGPMVELHDMCGPSGQPACLFGFVPMQHNQEDLEARVRRQIEALFGEQPEAVYIQRWWSEADTWPGGTGNGVDGFMGHPALRRTALDGRLYLISSETSARSPGHINGAVERAETVAAKVIQSLRP